MESSGRSGGLSAAAGNGAGPSGGGPQTTLIKRTLTAFMRFKWMILAIVALGTGAGVAARRFQVPVFETRATVWIQPGITTGGSGPITQGSLLNPIGWQGLLKSSSVLDSVVLQRRLFISLRNAADSMAFQGFGVARRMSPGSYRLTLDESRNGLTLQDANGSDLGRFAFGDSVGKAQGFRWVPARSAIPTNRPIEFTVTAPGEVSNNLATQIAVTQRMIQGRTDDNFLMVSLRGADGIRIAMTLEAVMHRFEDAALELKTKAVREQSAILSQQLQAAEQRLALAEKLQQDFMVNTATLPTEERGPGAPVPAGLAQTETSIIGNFFQLQTDKDLAVQDAVAIRRALTEFRGRIDLLTQLQVIPSVKQSATLGVAMQQALENESTLRVLRTTLMDANPQVVQKQEFQDTLLNVVIPREANRLLEVMAQSQADRDQRIASLAAEMREIPTRTITSQKLGRQVAIADQLYRELEGRYQSSRLAEVTTMRDIGVIDWPNPSYTPIEDPRRTLFMIFVGGSIALALVAAVLRDRLDPRVQYPDQVSSGMGLNILGAVPALRGGRLGPTDMALAVEAFRSIQLSLTHAVGNGGPIMVTFSSPGASDGKSFIASNLAIAFADMGHRTLVIDGDVRRGSMHKLLGAHHRPGLTEFLTGRADRATIIQETRYPLLHFIGCGSRQEAGPKLLGSPTMRQLVRDLRADYDVILVDSPPLGACVDPMILATLTRNLVLVVRTGSTDRSLAESKLDMLDRLPVRVVGAVLNDVEQTGPYRYYSYVSGYEVLDDEVQPAALAEPGKDGSSNPVGGPSDDT
jgi:tyrosine-protein kinase Etk/Wzc